MASGRFVRAMRHVVQNPVGQLLEAFNDTMNIFYSTKNKHFACPSGFWR